MRRTWTLIALIAGATVAAAVAHYAGAPSLLTFVIATAALAGLAWIVSFSTEQVGERFGPAVTGLLQSTLGNLPEFFIVVFALHAGGVAAAFASDWFITALTPAMHRIGVPKAFAGLVIVAIAGNAVENTAGVALALKGEADLAISVVKNSVAQITAFPALVLVSL